MTEQADEPWRCCASRERFGACEPECPYYVAPSPNPAELYRGWCAAHGSAPEAHDSLAAWARTLVLPRQQRVLTVDYVCRQLFPTRAPELLLALECAGCFDT